MRHMRAGLSYLPNLGAVTYPDASPTSWKRCGLTCFFRKLLHLHAEFQASVLNGTLSHLPPPVVCEPSWKQSFARAQPTPR